jgi:2-methylcitrate dehydratase
MAGRSGALAPDFMQLPQQQQDAILAVSLDQQKLETMPVNQYVDLYVI